MPRTVKVRRRQEEYIVVRRPVKYARLEFKTGVLQVIVPRDYKGRVWQIIERHRDWVNERKQRIREAVRESHGKGLVMTRTEDEFRSIVLAQVRTSCRELGVSVGRVFFRRMSSKWGSCSRRGNLTINRYMRFIPKRLIDYVVYHEVAHLKERGHKKRFWRIIRGRYPEEAARRREQELLTYWFLLQDALQEKPDGMLCVRWGAGAK